MKKLLSIFILSMFILSANAEFGGTVTRGISTDMLEVTTTSADTKKVYSTQADFLQAEGKTCEVATDGCNTVQIWNGQAGASTMMYCEHIYGEGQQEQWSCLKEVGVLSKNDQGFYETIQKRLDAKMQKQVQKVVQDYKKALSKIEKEKQKEVHAKAISRVEDSIFNLLNKYPQDIALPAKVNNQYLALSLLKFELMLVK